MKQLNSDRSSVPQTSKYICRGHQFLCDFSVGFLFKSRFYLTDNAWQLAKVYHGNGSQRQSSQSAGKNVLYRKLPDANDLIMKNQRLPTYRRWYGQPSCQGRIVRFGPQEDDHAMHRQSMAVMQQYIVLQNAQGQIRIMTGLQLDMQQPGRRCLYAQYLIRDGGHRRKVGIDNIYRIGDRKAKLCDPVGRIGLHQLFERRIITFRAALLRRLWQGGLSG